MPPPQKTLIVPEALGNTAECYLCLEGVCCCVAGLRDESPGEISGESGAGGAGVSDLASVTVILCEAMEGSAVCVYMETRLPSSGQIICQDSIVKMS